MLKEARERQRNTLLSVCLVSMGGKAGLGWVA